MRTWCLLVVMTCVVLVNSGRREVNKHGIPGVIKEELGRVSFAQDFLTVHIDLKPVVQFLSSLKTAKGALNDLLSHYDLKVVDNNTVSLLVAQKERLDMLLPARRKRALFSFGGDILHAVFGTATDKQFRRVDNKLAVIEKWANAKGKLINLAVSRVNSHGDEIFKLDQDVAKLAKIVNSNTLKSNKIQVNQNVLSLSNYLAFLLEQFDILSNAIILASHNIVSPSLLAPSELQGLLNNAKENFGFQLLYDEDDINNYYHVLDCKIVSDSIYLFVPFASAVSFQLYNLVPFPTLLNNSIVVELDISNSYVMVDEEFDLLSISSRNYFTEYCIAVASQDYLCPANKFHFYPSSKFDCLLHVATQARISQTCNYRTVNNKTIAIHHSPPFNYFFSKTELKLTLTCGGGRPTLESLKGNFALHEDCGVSAPNVLKIFPSHSQTADANPSIPHFTPVVLRPLKFTDTAKQVVLERLRKEQPIEVQPDDPYWAALDQAHPYVSFIVTPVLVVISVIALIVVGRCIYIRKLRATIQRVRQLYDDQVRPTLHNDPEGGVSTTTA